MSSNTTTTSIPDTTTLPGTTTPLPPTTTPTTAPTTPTTTPTTAPTTTPTTAPTTTPTTAAPPPATTSTSTAPPPPPSTQIITSVVSVAPSNGTPVPPSTVIVTQISTPTPDATTSSTRSGGIPAGASNSATAGSGSKGDGGLSPAGTIAIAVVIPVVVVALLVFAGLFWWRRRKQRKVDEDERRKEMEAYGFNPNEDPTLPVVVGGMDGSDDQSGYRGWGGGSTAVGTMSNRKASTTLSSGAGNPAAYSPGSPNAGTDASGEALMGGAGAGAGAAAAAVAAGTQHSRNTTMDSDTVNPAYANMHSSKGAGVQRGPSNASSTYSMGGASHASNDAPIPVNSNEQYYSDYYQSGPYDNPYNGGQEAVIRDNPARRNTRIERAPTFPNQGSSGVATNF